MANQEKKTDWDGLALRLSNVFQPSAPINSDRLFMGRTAQVRAVVDAINQPGRHAILFGGRGVGKTSLGKILPKKLHTEELVPIICPYVTCDSTDDYASIWRKAFIEIRYQVEGADAQAAHDQEEIDPLTDPSTAWVPFEVRRALEPFASEGLLYVVFDEFDKLEETSTCQMMADTIKLFSDHAVPATLIVIGVADNATGLIKEHQSIDRCLAQIPMPRMPRHELEEIVDTGLRQVGMSIAKDALHEITGLSKGLPTYVHLLALHSSREALDARHLDVRLENVKGAIKIAISHSEETIRAEYDKATFSSRETLHADVLLACAMARTDEYGRFVPNDVCGPMKIVTGQEYKSDRFSTHLKQFCTPDRGTVLRMTGSEYRWRYQFRNPLLQPFVLMKGLDAKRITEEQLNLNSGDDEYPLFRSTNY
jgi:Cdc6-like AAA superfamily ATPase